MRAHQILESRAKATINYREEDIAQRVSELTQGKKVAVVYDSVGKDTWEPSLDSLQRHGLLVSFGNASGPVTGVDLGIPFLKGLTVQYLLRQTWKVKADETFLFHAAAGGVGLIACQWAKALGAHLIGTVGSAEKAQIAKAAGA
ncbi:hypothetical protein CRX72_06530 [Pantoea sp. BRM17]|nr:hypothetical protein CRX72_06530 [Pantoea sp. BRM17]